MGKVKVKSQKSKVQVKSKNFEFCLVVFTFSFCLLTFLLHSPAMVNACPMCKELLFDPGQLAQKFATAKGYALSIGLLLLVPFVLIASITALVIRACRRAKTSTHS